MSRRVIHEERVDPPLESAEVVVDELQGWITRLVGTVVGADQALVRLHLLVDRVERAEKAVDGCLAAGREAQALMVWRKASGA